MNIAIGMIGGLSLFLFGMTYMGDGLQRAAGSRLKELIAVLTKNKLMGVLVGAIVTMIIQSSSATTVMTVGFVNAGIMNLQQAIGIIMGANIGTTITAQLVAFELTVVAPLIIGIGVVMFFGAKRKKTKDTAQILIGFGILFLGMSMMKDSIKPLKESQIFIDVLKNLNNSYVGIFAGFAITAILQSSSATTGLLIAVASSGLISIDMAFPIIFGQNIGTCVTAMISSIGANKAAKRTAVMHLCFNLLGTLIFLFLLRKPVEYLVLTISPVGIERQIANAHTFFNIINVVILFPFSGLIVKAAERIVKGDEDEETSEVKYIDNRLLATPPIAIAQASREVLRMANLVIKQYSTAKIAFIEKNEKAAHEVFEIERHVNNLQSDILNFLVKLTKTSLTDRERDKLVTLINTVNDVERVGDNSDNIAEFALYKIDNNIEFSQQALDEVKKMFEITQEVFQNSILALKTADVDISKQVIKKDITIDIIEKELRKNHIDRLNTNVCNPGAAIIFLDTIGSLERIGDHSSNIAIAIIEVINRRKNVVDEIYE